MTKRKSIYFALGFHNHQPVGNFPFVFEDAYEHAYAPFLEILDRHPGVKVALHYSGPLWDDYLARHPAWRERLRACVRRGQVEMLTGAYYEAILPAIPDVDKIGQIQAMSRLIETQLGVTPAGAWIAERVWEPGLPRILAQTGVRYTLLDESHFRYAGVQPDGVFKVYTTEEQGAALAVVPTALQLRRLIPWKDPQDTIDYLARHATEDGTRLATFADDGEKFGVWPGTRPTARPGGWLDTFFGLLEEHRNWITVVTCSEYMAAHPPADRIYLPTASYPEMMAWALPTPAGKQFHAAVEELKQAGRFDACEPFAKGGIWNNFLVKYPEANQMHKKALRVSGKVHAMKGPGRDAALRELWKGQCNCAYWHGVFGGIYLNHIRSAVYEHLVAAETLADREAHGGRPFAAVTFTDLDRDGRDEALVETDQLNLYLDPSRGGSLIEWDCKSPPTNLLNTLSRREEAYHDTLWAMNGRGDEERGTVSIHDRVKAKEAHLDAYLTYDTYRRGALVDHFLGDEATVDLFRQGRHPEQGDFVDQPYEAWLLHPGPEGRVGGEAVSVALMRRGHVLVGRDRHPVSVLKIVTAAPGQPGFSVAYTVENRTDRTGVQLWFAPEWTLHFLSRKEGGLRFHPGGSATSSRSAKFSKTGAVPEAAGCTLEDPLRGLALRLDWTLPAGVWHMPLETVSQSEDGFERVFQGVTLLPWWRLTLGPGERWTVDFSAAAVPPSGTPHHEADASAPRPAAPDTRGGSAPG